MCFGSEASCESRIQDNCVGYGTVFVTYIAEQDHCGHVRVVNEFIHEHLFNELWVLEVTCDEPAQCVRFLCVLVQPMLLVSV